MNLKAQPLTADAFVAYGTVLQAPASDGRFINGGTTERFDLIDDLQLSSSGGRAQLALFCAQARSFPQALIEMERHLLGSQSFVPIGTARRFVIVVAPAGDPPSADALVAFVTDGHQGVTLAPGTWHHALLAVDAGNFIVVERAADAVDCDICKLPDGVSVVY